jgi:hypothetical protein
MEPTLTILQQVRTPEEEGGKSGWRSGTTNKPFWQVHFDKQDLLAGSL